MRSEAQKAADKRYRETHAPTHTTWTAHITPSEQKEFAEVLKEANLGKTEFLRMAIKRLKKSMQNGESWD